MKKSLAFICLSDICHSDKRNGSYYSNFPGFFSVNKHKNPLCVYTTLILSQYATDKSVDNPREDKFSLASWWKYKYIRSLQNIYRNYRVIGLKDVWINVWSWLEQTDTREHRKETWEKSSFATGIMVNGFLFSGGEFERLHDVCCGNSWLSDLSKSFV